MVGTLTCTPTLCVSRSGSNSNKGVIHTHQISRMGALLSDAVECHFHDTTFLLSEYYNLYGRKQIIILKGKIIDLFFFDMFFIVV